MADQSLCSDPTRPTLIASACAVIAPDGSSSLVESGKSRPVRSASVLKPGLFWAAVTDFDSPEAWRRAAELGVVMSDNAETSAIWGRIGGRSLLDRLEQLTGQHWETDPPGEETMGSVLIRPHEVVAAYLALAAAAQNGDENAAIVLGFMRRVPEEQTFGVRQTVSTMLHAPEADVAIKTGWFCDDDYLALRTHAVTVTSTEAGTYVTAVLTSIPVLEADAIKYLDTFDTGPELLPFHENAGRMVSAETASALGRFLTGATERRLRN